MPPTPASMLPKLDPSSQAKFALGDFLLFLLASRAVATSPVAGRDFCKRCVSCDTQKHIRHEDCIAWRTWEAEKPRAWFELRTPPKQQWFGKNS